MKIYRDAEGVSRHIGEWEYLAIDNGDGIIIVNNPLPPEYTFADEEVVTGWDGGLYAHDDPRQFKPE